MGRIWNIKQFQAASQGATGAHAVSQCGLLSRLLPVRLHVQSFVISQCSSILILIIDYL